MAIFHCYVSSPEGNKDPDGTFWDHLRPRTLGIRVIAIGVIAVASIPATSAWTPETSHNRSIFLSGAQFFSNLPISIIEHDLRKPGNQ